MSCPAKDKGEVPRRGQASAEFYENGKPRYFCRGYIDKMTDELIDTCRSCRQNVIYAQEELEKGLRKSRKEDRPE